MNVTTRFLSWAFLLFLSVLSHRCLLAASAAITVVLETTAPLTTPPKVELAPFPHGKDVAVTCSWDDGPETDLRMAKLLAKYGWKGTFYWNVPGGAMKHVHDFLELGMEIGTHSATHPMLDLQNDGHVFWQLMLSRIFLEALSDRPVNTVSYPFGTRDDSVDLQVMQAGLLTGRGTGVRSKNRRLYDVNHFENRMAQPSIHLFPPGNHSGNMVRNALAELTSEAAPGSILAFWGHTRWNDEFGSEQDWKTFEEILRRFAKHPKVWYATHAELASWQYLRHGIEIRVKKVEADACHIAVMLQALPAVMLPVPVALKMRGVPAGRIQSVKVRGHEIAWQDRGDAICLDLPAPIPKGPDTVSAYIDVMTPRIRQAVVQHQAEVAPQSPFVEPQFRVEQVARKSATVRFVCRNRSERPLQDLCVALRTTHGIQVEPSHTVTARHLAGEESRQFQWKLSRSNAAVGTWHLLVVSVSFFSGERHYREYHAKEVVFPAGEEENNLLISQALLFGAVPRSYNGVQPSATPRAPEIHGTGALTAYASWKPSKPVLSGNKHRYSYMNLKGLFHTRDKSRAQRAAYVASNMLLQEPTTISPSMIGLPPAVKSLQVWIDGRKLWQFPKSKQDDPVTLDPGMHPVLFRLEGKVMNPWQRIGFFFEPNGCVIHWRRPET